MFVIKDESEFPLVKVKFGKEINNFDDLNLFFNLWNKLYQDKKDFTFLLDTSECGKIPIKYSYYMAKKIKEIKKLKKHYLNYTIIILESRWMIKLMKILFGIIKPIAPVYIVKNKKDANDIYFRLSNNLLKSDINYEIISNK